MLSTERRVLFLHSGIGGEKGTIAHRKYPGLARRVPRSQASPPVCYESCGDIARPFALHLDIARGRRRFLYALAANQGGLLAPVTQNRMSLPKPFAKKGTEFDSHYEFAASALLEI